MKFLKLIPLSGNWNFSRKKKRNQIYGLSFWKRAHIPMRQYFDSSLFVDFPPPATLQKFSMPEPEPDHHSGSLSTCHFCFFWSDGAIRSQKSTTILSSPSSTKVAISFLKTQKLIFAYKLFDEIAQCIFSPTEFTGPFSFCLLGFIFMFFLSVVC